MISLWLLERIAVADRMIVIVLGIVHAVLIVALLTIAWTETRSRPAQPQDADDVTQDFAGR